LSYTRGTEPEEVLHRPEEPTYGLPVRTEGSARPGPRREGGRGRPTGRTTGPTVAAMTSASPTPVVPSADEVRRAYREELGPRERAVLWAWLGFTVTFGTVRVITYSIRAGRGPFRNLSLGGEHLHHYMWGIAALAGVGAIAVRGDDRTRRHPVVGATYGSGLALIVDEFALLLDLQDVYWAKQGRISVDLGVGLVAAGGTTFSAIPVLRRLRRDRQSRVSPRRSRRPR
jgi:hypothetical protein